VPSQNGLFAEPPQRQSHVFVSRAIVRPLVAQISSDPSTTSGPFCFGVIFNGPLRTASGSVCLLAGSPVAVNPASAWLWSQYGLFLE
jgi:hypothetical protein